jgi:hypothetical protein
MSVATVLLPRTVRCEERRAIFDGFVETDPTVVELLGGTAESERLAHEILHLGARMVSAGGGASALHDLEARVTTALESLSGSIRATIQSSLTELSGLGRSLFAPEGGELTAALAAWRAEFDRHLGTMFDPDSKRSVINAIERSITSMLQEHGRKIVAFADPDDSLSAGGRLLAHVRQN